jgi:hypothetical protein
MAIGRILSLPHRQGDWLCGEPLALTSPDRVGYNAQAVDRRGMSPDMMKTIQSPSPSYLQSLVDRELAPTAVRVALIVGSIVFLINHGWALLDGQMTRSRWISGVLTYAVPYMVNIHGQYIRRRRSG